MGGWPDAIGEDIVLTWALLRRGWRTTHEPQAIAFTSVPESLAGLLRQRRRWARGMIEGLRTHRIPILRSGEAFTQPIAADFALPYLDFVYALVFPAGVVLACFGMFAIVGPMTLAVIPLNGLLAVMYLRAREAFHARGLAVRRARLGFCSSSSATSCSCRPSQWPGTRRSCFIYAGAGSAGVAPLPREDCQATK